MAHGDRRKLRSVAGQATDFHGFFHGIKERKLALPIQVDAMNDAL